MDVKKARAERPYTYLSRLKRQETFPFRCLYMLAPFISQLDKGSLTY